MKSAVVLALAGASAALTTPMISSSRSMICKRQDPVPFDPLLEVPDAWQFTLLSWSGSGCPDYPTKSYNYTPPYQETHMSSGPFMFNSSLDTYWWYIAYPFMEVQLPKESDVKLVKSTCTVEVAYQQTNEYGGKVKGTHRLRLHKNGTLVQANYQLDEGVSVEWQSRYYSATDETVVANDIVSVEGPLTHQSNKTMKLDFLRPLFSEDHLVLPECGTGTFHMRFDLWLAARKAGVGGNVDSSIMDWGNGRLRKDGVNHGISYDWERCAS